MQHRAVVALVIAAFMAVTVGCQSIPEQHRGAATGAGVGAATGTLAGAVLGSKGAKTETAILGGLVGALVGGAIGHYAVDQRRDRQTTAQQYNYQPSAGTMVRLENAAATPVTARPGDTVNLEATYAVLTPSQAGSVPVTETREIRHQGALIGNPQVTVNRPGGTYTSSVPLILPQNAQSGAYTVMTTVQSGTVKDTRETRFTVQ